MCSRGMPCQAMPCNKNTNIRYMPYENEVYNSKCEEENETEKWSDNPNENKSISVFVQHKQFWYAMDETEQSGTLESKLI